MAGLNKYQKAAAAKYRNGAIGDLGGQIEIDGLRELQKDLRLFGAATRDDMKETHRRAGEIIVEGARRFVPVRTGALLASMRSAPTQRQGRVRVGSASVPYAGPIHFGWPARNIRPNPFIYEVLDQRRQDIYKLYADRISGLIEKYDLGPGTARPPRSSRSSTSSGNVTRTQRSGSSVVEYSYDITQW